MKNSLVQVFLFALLFMLMALPSSVISQEEEDFLKKTKFTSRVLSLTTCNVYPKKCKANGSPGQDCCNNRCVNMLSDHLNCGKCGHTCKFLERCCAGKCVNPLSDTNNCGSCSNKCRHHPHKKPNCVFAMCSYA